MAVILAAALWAVLGIVCIILGYVFAFLHGNPDGRMLKKAKQGLLCGGYLFSLWKRKMLRKLQLSRREEQYYRAIYVNEDPLLSRLMPAGSDRIRMQRGICRGYGSSVRRRSVLRYEDQCLSEAGFRYGDRAASGYDGPEEL